MKAVLEPVDPGDLGWLLRWYGAVGVRLPDEWMGEGARLMPQSKLLCEDTELNLSSWSGLTCS